MASLLRSGKFVRFFSNLTRNLDFHNGGKTNAENQLLTRKKEWEIKIYRSLSTVNLPRKAINDGGNVVTSVPAEQNSVDRALARAEFDAKKLGRVSRDDVKSIVEEIKAHKCATSTQGLLLIRCCGSLIPEELPSVRTKLVKDIWKMLESLAVPLDISHYNSLLTVYLDNEHSYNPLEFLAILAEKKIQPNRVTYQRLLASYCQKGDIDGASQILEMMKARDMPIGEFVFNSLITGHSNAGDLESAEGIVKLMTQAGLEPDNETYKALLCGYAKQGLIEKITSTIADCEKNKIILHDRDLLEVLHTAAVNKHPAIVDDLLARMKKLSGYNQECFNVILRLVNHGHEDEGFKVLLNMKPSLLTDGQSSMSGGFFIRQIVKCECEPEKIVNFCQRLVDSGMNARAYFRALEAANAFGNKKLSEVLLKEIAKQKGTMRPSVFWPLLNNQSKVNGEQGIFDVLHQMATIRVLPDVSTISHHVLPHLAADSTKSLIRKLRSADVPAKVVAQSLVADSLDRLDFKSAIEISNIYQLPSTPLTSRFIAKAYVKTEDASSLVLLIQAMLRRTIAEGTPAEIKDRAAEIAGPIVQEVYTVASKPKLKMVQPLLQALLENGIGIPQSVSSNILEMAGMNMTESVAELLATLASGNLMPTELKQVDKNRYQRFVSFAYEKNLDEALKEKENLESSKIPFTNGLNITLMDLYLHHGKIDEALEIFNKLFEHNPDITVTPKKVMNLAASLLQAERTEDAFKVLGKLKPGSDEISDVKIAEFAATRLLKVPALKGDVELTKKVFGAIEDSKILKTPRLITNPLVKVHLVQDDIENALKTFAECAEKYKTLPCRSELTKKFIESEDAQRLQELMDISIKTIGEMNSLYDLVFDFLACGRIRQARKVLQTPGLRDRRQRIVTACQRYLEENRVTDLENLVKITNDVFDVDRHVLYDYLLRAYIKASDPKKAAALWTQMQEEDLLPKDDFLRKLGQFLTDSNQPVPFNVPSAPEKVSNESSAPVAVTVQQKRKPERKGEAQSLVNAAKPKRHECSILIKASVKEGRLADATKQTVDALVEKTNLDDRVLNNVLYALSDRGDHESLAMIGQHLDQEKRRLVKYDSRFVSSLAYNSSAATEYLDNTLEEIKALATETDLDKKERKVKLLETKMPCGSLFEVLEKNPDLLPKCQKLAGSFLEQGGFSPTKALWCFYMTNGFESEAKSAWEVISKSPMPLYFRPICEKAKVQGNPALVESLIETLSSSSKVEKRLVGVAYSAWVDLHCTKNELDAALGVVERALKCDVQLKDISRNVLKALKSTLETSGRTFPYSIPQREQDPGSRKSQPQSDEH